jgi:hypothetical protein
MAAELDPLLGKALELVGELVALGGGEIERGKIERDVAIAEAET